MDQGVDDSNQPAISQSSSVAEFKQFAECFARAFQASPYVQTVTTFDTGCYLYVNDCFVKAAGYAREEVIGKTSIELGLMPDKADRAWLTGMLQRRGRLTRKKLRFRLRSGDVRIGLFNAEVIKLADGDVILSTVTDITEQLATEHRLRLQYKRVALVEQLAAGLAHEVRNPLAGIKGVADAFLQRRRLTKQEREWMEVVRGQVTKIDSLLAELLDLTQPRVFSIKQCSLNELVRRVVLLARHQANSLSERAILVEFIDATQEPLEMDLDAAQIEDAVLNLVLNGIESIQQGGQVSVRISRRPRDAEHHEAVITVTDTGCGIPLEHRESIFEPFFTTKRHGTGIGLSAVQRTVAAFHGRISFQTRVGRGSTFELTLPLLATKRDTHER
jgi:PAS domain S-box-containing protein